MINISANKKLTPEQEVNTLGKWLYRNLDGAFKFKKSSSQYNIWFLVLYEVPLEIRERYDLDESYDDVNEMVINLSLVTYKNASNSKKSKIRVNLIEESPDELTVGSKIYNLDFFNDYYELRDNLVNYLIVRLNKHYEGYDFIY